MPTIIRNSAKCAKCGDEIESKHRHDWVSCKCRAIFIDGGKDYQRVGGNLEDFIDTSIYISDKAFGER
jgi:DNA-directed RNA polymerase subunit RPC12/RpoP